MKINIWSAPVLIIRFDEDPEPNELINVPVIEIVNPSSDTNNEVFGVIPNGVINGSNATFTITDAFVPESVQVFRNGLSQYNPTHFHTTGNHTIILNFSPIVGDILTVNYYKA